MMVVLFIISSVINGVKKKNQEQKPMPPFNNKPTTMFDLPNKTEARKSLEDFASEVFQQLNEKVQPNASEKPVESLQVPDKVKEVVEKEIESRRPVFDDKRSSNRSSSIPLKEPKADEIKQGEIGKLVPTTREALVNAIITTEILGPPRAKQHR